MVVFLSKHRMDWFRSRRDFAISSQWKRCDYQPKKLRLVEWKSHFSGKEQGCRSLKLHNSTAFLQIYRLCNKRKRSNQLSNWVLEFIGCDQTKLCNWTRLAVTKLMTNVIHARVLKGMHKGEEYLIPRIPMIPTHMPFEFKRIQFPISLSFAMTINKSKGHSLSVDGTH